METKTNATDAYTAARERVDRQLRQIRTRLAKHATKQRAQPKNWDLVGDLGHLADLLNEAIEFMGGEREETTT